MIRVLIVAQTPAIRAGLRALLTADGGLHVAAEATSLRDLRHLPPDIDLLLLDEESAARGALERLLAREEPRLGLLMLASAAEAARAVAGLPLRAWGLLPPETSAEELSAAVRALHEGLLVGPPALLGPLLARPGLLTAADIEPLDEALTAREMEVLHLLAQGLANKQIAAALTISEHTVKFHVSSIYAKLGATNRTEAVSLGARRGLVTL